MLLLSLLYCQVTCAALSASAVQPVQPRALTEVCRYTFDRHSDLDLDGQPDDWVRRKGLEFPHYVDSVIDHTSGFDDQSSLRIDANGAAAIYYSPLVPIDDLHTYFFSGYIRTKQLKHDAAMISISMLDHRRRRVQRVLSRPVMGDHAEWVPIQIGPITPQNDVRFVVLGCHVVTGTDDVRDIGGQVWFDDLQVGRLPRMEMESNFYRHFISGSSPVEISCQVSGLDPGHQYALDIQFYDVNGQRLHETHLPLDEDVELTDRRLAEFLKPQTVKWTLDRLPPGYYSATATLLRDGTAVASQPTTLVILSLVGEPRKTGEFGWSIAGPLGSRAMSELPEIAAQAGINWLKYPVWQMAGDTELQTVTETAAMFDGLITIRVSPIALLSEPPVKLRRKFARNWHGVNEVFSLPPEFWEGTLEPVVARFSSSVQQWQLGAERDSSFVGSTTLPQTLRNVRDRIRRISLSADLGLPWKWDAGAPDPEAKFVSLSTEGLTTIQELNALLKSTSMGSAGRWVLMRLSQLSGESVHERSADLARLMLAAKMGGAQRIFLGDVYHDDYGLLNSDGSPRELFIPWRTVALLLQDAEYLGAFHFSKGSPNAVFAKDGEAAVIVWSDEPTQESLYLGVQPLEMDLWGQTTPVPEDAATGESILKIGPVPKLLIHCSEAVARWRIAAQYAHGRMPSVYGGHDDTIKVTNTFPQGVSGELSLTLPKEWEAEPSSWSIAAEAGETLEFPTHLRLPPNANLGDQMTMWDFHITADRPYRFRVYRPYTVGLDDLKFEVFDRKLPDGRLEIEQVVTNLTDPVEKLDFRCSLFVPDARRQKVQITKLGQGTDRKFYYLPDADRYRDRELWLRLEQDGGRRIINYRWNVGTDW